MGEDINEKVTTRKTCSYCSRRRDCDGDWGNYCCAPDDYKCGQKNFVRDCDGDTIITFSL